MKILAPRVGPLVLVAALAARAASASPVPGWEQSGPPSYALVHSVSPARDGSATVYAAASDPATAQSAAFRSDDAGATWTPLATALPGDTASSIAVDPRDSRRVFATTYRQVTDYSFSTRLYASTDAGVTWRFGGDFPTACGGTFAFDTARPLAVYADLACSGELLASEDAGLTWASRNVSLDLLRSGPDGALYGVGTNRGIIRSVDGGFSWTDIDSPPCPFGIFITALAIDSQGRLFAGTGRIRMIFIDCAGLFRSDDGGGSWTQILPRYVTDIVIDREESSRIYIYAPSFPFGGGDVYATDDGGDHWRPLNLPASAFGLALSPSGRLLYAGTDQGLFRLPILKTLVVAPR